MRSSLSPALLVIVLAGCQSKPAPEAAQTPAAAAPATPARPVVKPSDETRRFPPANRQDGVVVLDHLLGKDFLPGGNLATYKKGSKEYQMFLVKGKDATEPALWLLDLKKGMADAKLVPGFGGYFGTDGGKPLFAFTKNNYLAGVVGLPQKDADAVSRELAVRIP
jgi:hypothetical protein